MQQDEGAGEEAEAAAAARLRAAVGNWSATGRLHPEYGIDMFVVAAESLALRK